MSNRSNCTQCHVKPINSIRKSKLDLFEFDQNRISFQWNLLIEIDESPSFDHFLIYQLNLNEIYFCIDLIS